MRAREGNGQVQLSEQHNRRREGMALAIRGGAQQSRRPVTSSAICADECLYGLPVIGIWVGHRRH